MTISSKQAVNVPVLQHSYSPVLVPQTSGMWPTWPLANLRTRVSAKCSAWQASVACVSGIMKTTEAAAKVLAIDGCPLNCVAHCLQHAGFTEFEHLQLADLDMVKGKTAPSDTAVARATNAAAEKLRMI